MTDILNWMDYVHKAGWYTEPETRLTGVKSLVVQWGIVSLLLLLQLCSASDASSLPAHLHFPYGYICHASQHSRCVRELTPKDFILSSEICSVLVHRKFRIEAPKRRVESKPPPCPPFWVLIYAQMPRCYARMESLLWHMQCPSQ